MKVCDVCNLLIELYKIDDEGLGGVDSYKVKKKLRFCDVCS